MVVIAGVDPTAHGLGAHVRLDAVGAPPGRAEVPVHVVGLVRVPQAESVPDLVNGDGANVTEVAPRGRPVVREWPARKQAEGGVPLLERQADLVLDGRVRPRRVKTGVEFVLDRRQVPGREVIGVVVEMRVPGRVRRCRRPGPKSPGSGRDDAGAHKNDKHRA